MQLSAYLADKGISDADFAQAIGVTRQAVHRYKTGGRLPEWPVLAKIREATDGAVTADDFLPSPEPQAGVA
jgi:transcriptional regulator with XRE-family HTH domain